MFSTLVQIGLLILAKKRTSRTKKRRQTAQSDLHLHERDRGELANGRGERGDDLLAAGELV